MTPLAGMMSSGFGSRPRLDLNFLGGGLDPRITFTRASSGTHFNNTGLLVAASTDVARFDYDPVTLAPLGLLIEEARTNLALNSGDTLSGGFGGVVVADQITAPDGSLADFFQEDTGNSEHYAGDRVVAVTAGTTYTWSFYAKLGLAGEARRACVRTGAQGPASVAFDLETGSGTLIGGAVSFGISSAGNGWWRCWIVFIATGTGLAVFRQQLSIGTNTVYTGNGTSGLFFWGAQLEAGSFPTSYIPTGTEAATRAADVAVMTGTNFSSWYNQSEGTFVSRQSRPPTAIADGNVFQADDGTDNNRLSQGTGSAGNVLNPSIIVGGVAQAVLTQGANTGLGEKSCAVAYKLNDFAAASNGDSAVTDVSGTPPTVNELWIGKSFAAAYWNGHIHSIRFYSSRLPDATLQSLSAP